MAEEKKSPKFWYDVNSASGNVSLSSTSTTASTHMVMIDLGKYRLEPDIAEIAMNEANEARQQFEDAKKAFQVAHGVIWNPKIQFTSPDAKLDSERLIALRDEAARRLAKVMAIARK